MLCCAISQQDSLPLGKERFEGAPPTSAVSVPGKIKERNGNCFCGRVADVVLYMSGLSVEHFFLGNPG